MGVCCLGDGELGKVVPGVVREAAQGGEPGKLYLAVVGRCRSGVERCDAQCAAGQASNLEKQT